MEIIDKQKFIDAFIGGESYKYLNTLVFGVATVTSNEVPNTIEDWINQTDNLEWLAFMEHVMHPDEWTADSEKAYHELYSKVLQGDRISVNDWQGKVKGKSLLCANGQYFANPYVVLAICTSLNDDVWKIFEPALEKIKQLYPNEYNAFVSMNISNKNAEIFPFVSVHSFENIKWYYQLVYFPNQVLDKQNAYFASCMGYAYNYMVAYRQIHNI